ncbi:hypothetical protein B0H11DRAFT_2162297 [Mycena galericulata]|nr:hypothetical protein B0H11DRAFT_2162297 [Mycena galericulata]
MVSALWKACSQGDLESVNQALATCRQYHTGVTPLIEAIKNGHTDIVRALLDKGADPTNASSQGPPETYTVDPAILGMLNLARNQRSQVSGQENGYDTNDTNTYPPPPPANYPYYPSIASAPPPDMYYHQPPPQMHLEHNGSRHSNLPPPEVASAIPCRYFPACRYGSACLFQHPQGPYFQGPLPPPAQYPTSYDQMPPQTYAPTYYPVPPPSFPPTMNGQHSMPPLPPQQGPPMPMHGPSPEMMSPPPQGHFSPNGAPVIPYGPISPMMSPMYSHPGQTPLPMSIPPLPPLHRQPPPPPAPQSPQTSFNPSSPLSAPQSTFVVQQNPATQYPPVNGNGAVSYPEGNGVAAKSPQQPDASLPGRDGPGAGRRGTGRRGSFPSRKQAPPCIFFPTGRCKNGTLATVKKAPAVVDPAARGRGNKSNFNAQANKRASAVKQRVPNADEFPVLSGYTTPPARSPGVNGSLPNGNGHAGPTAAQILQAPRPTRSNSSQAITPRGVTPERVKVWAELKPEVNGTEAHHSPKMPVSFAAVATAGSDVSVAA